MYNENQGVGVAEKKIDTEVRRKTGEQGVGAGK